MKTIVWFRQDLRLNDNPALYSALKEDEVIPIYIWDELLDGVLTLGGASKWWLHHSLQRLAESLSEYNLPLYLFNGDAEPVLKNVLHTTGANRVVWNRCYEPAAIERDTRLKRNLKELGVSVDSFNSNLLFEPWEVQNKSGSFFKVFTPFWKQCLTQIPQLFLDTGSLLEEASPVATYNLESIILNDLNLLPANPNWADELKFEQLWTPGEGGAQVVFKNFLENHIVDYKDKRDFMSCNATSRLSAHLHFGEISPRQIWETCRELLPRYKENAKGIQCFLSEIGWREFSYHLLFHVPTLPFNPFKQEFNGFPWNKNDVYLKAWQQGKTGIPIVDAAMRELWQTGYMHNRARMIVASFLTKNLRIHWKKGADWFWDTLVDADMASNSASWQWVAGCGADAAPYFRIFNPVLQGEKFDVDGAYVKRWVPELSQLPSKYIHQPWGASKEILNDAGVVLGESYPKPIVDLKQTRDEALAAYEVIKKSNN